MNKDVMLGIETSQRRGSVAARVGRGEIAVEWLRNEREQSDDLMPAIVRLLERMGRRVQDVRGIGVSIGPGGFTGLRIAIASVKMLAEVLGAKVAAVPSALVAAEGVEAKGRILVGLASKGETMWATRLIRNEAGWRIDGVPELADVNTLDLAEIACVVVDSHAPNALRARCAERGVKVEAPEWNAGKCLRIAERMIERGESLEGMELSPLYPRQPEAVTLWERREGAARE
ncbi:MAG TPA: tRNA (adenosine(37)-N6)-threonylcarbamoyltransferase complex dimerization subunit type 1 TsaB [Phycisphaerales bacterium]|nr:tRNA (adenosine(37)-N6)-threonylcarbamoyltransferase complex dimerization subunit type 1 TsaB [Phycisphaerales bacterium]